MKCFVLLPLLSLLTHCTAQPGSTPSSLPPTFGGMPQIVNVSAYDPKEKQRTGSSYSEHDVSALRANGASALIARAGKGGNLDTKCANFLASAIDHSLLRTVIGTIAGDDTVMLVTKEPDGGAAVAEELLTAAESARSEPAPIPSAPSTQTPSTRKRRSS